MGLRLDLVRSGDAGRRVVEVGMKGEIKMSGPDKYTKADETTAAARKIIDAQKRKQDAKTVRLRDARLASGATGAGEPATIKSKRKSAVKARP